MVLEQRFLLVELDGLKSRTEFLLVMEDTEKRLQKLLTFAPDVPASIRKKYLTVLNPIMPEHVPAIPPSMLVVD